MRLKNWQNFGITNFLELKNEQEQGIAAQIVQVVIAGNSFEIPRELLNGQVRKVTHVLDIFAPIYKLLYLTSYFEN